MHRADGARWREWEGGKYAIDMAVWELLLVKTGLHTVESQITFTGFISPIT